MDEEINVWFILVLLGYCAMLLGICCPFQDHIVQHSHRTSDP